MSNLSTSRYNKTARSLHWWMAAFIVLAFTFINLHTQFPRGSPERALMLTLHYWCGIAVLLLAFPRVANRYRNRPPAIQPRLSGVMHALADATHYLIYAFILAQPLLGFFAQMIGHGRLSIPFVAVSIPWPFEVSRTRGHALQALHEMIGVAFYYLLGLHVAAALFHHFVRRDNTLKRMV